jgi:hypothetical protein
MDDELKQSLLDAADELEVFNDWHRSNGPTDRAGKPTKAARDEWERVQKKIEALRRLAR